MTVTVIFDKEANLIRDIILQETCLDVQNLVKHTGDMKAESLTLMYIFDRTDLFGSEPSAVGESVLQFITVAINLFGSEDGSRLLDTHFTDTLKLIIDLLVLGGKLEIIGDVLPLTSATDSEVWTRSRDALG